MTAALHIILGFGLFLLSQARVQVRVSKVGGGLLHECEKTWEVNFCSSSIWNYCEIEASLTYGVRPHLKKRIINIYGDREGGREGEEEGEGEIQERQLRLSNGLEAIAGCRCVII